MVKAALFVFSVISFVVGAFMYLVPSWVASPLLIDINDTFADRILGMALVSLGVGAWVTSKESEMGTARTVLLMCAIFTVLGAIACLYQVLMTGASLFWLYLIVLAVLAVIFVGSVRQVQLQRGERR